MQTLCLNVDHKLAPQILVSCCLCTKSYDFALEHQVFCRIINSRQSCTFTIGQEHLKVFIRLLVVTVLRVTSRNCFM